MFGDPNFISVLYHRFMQHVFACHEFSVIMRNCLLLVHLYLFIVLFFYNLFTCMILFCNVFVHLPVDLGFVKLYILQVIKYITYIFDRPL